MSVHRTLGRGDELKRQRSVLTREERLAKMEDEGKWTEGEDSIYGLPKLRVVKARKIKKKKEEAVAEGELAEGAEGAVGMEGAAAPAPGGDEKKK